MSVPSRHRAPPRFPFAAVVVAIVVVAGLVVGARAVLSHDSGKPSANETSGGVTTPPATSGGGQTSVGGSGSGPPPTKANTSPSPRPKGALVIHGAGDTNVDSSYIRVPPSSYDTLLSGMNGLFIHDDLTVVNLECSVTHLGTPVPKEFNFHGDPAALPKIGRAHV